MKDNYKEKTGFEFPFQNPEVQQKSQITYREKTGYSNPAQNPQVQQKMKDTYREKTGFEFPLQNPEVKEKGQATNMLKYNCRNPMQNPTIAEKASKNSYRYKDYITPSKKVLRIQGYEHFALDELFLELKYTEEDIVTGMSNVPSISYKTDDKVSRVHFPDIYIPSEKRLIEIKSTWTAEKKKDCIFHKKESALKQGFLYEIWIYDAKGVKTVL